jgi:uncharacterized protein YecT (DUF1311 family)
LELVSIEFVCNGAHHAKKDRHEWLDPCPIVDRYKEAITAIKAALEAKDEPERCTPNCEVLLQKIVTQRTWVGLTDDEKESLSYKAEGNTWAAIELAEAKLKEKNNG